MIILNGMLNHLTKVVPPKVVLKVLAPSHVAFKITALKVMALKDIALKGMVLKIMVLNPMPPN
jgi:hypothetical protein